MAVNLTPVKKATKYSYEKTQRKVFHKELCSRLKFELIEKRYMHQPESILDNEMNEILWDFEMLMEH